MVATFLVAEEESTIKPFSLCNLLRTNTFLILWRQLEKEEGEGKIYREENEMERENGNGVEIEMGGMKLKDQSFL